MTGNPEVIAETRLAQMESIPLRTPEILSSPYLAGKNAGSRAANLPRSLVAKTNILGTPTRNKLGTEHPKQGWRRSLTRLFEIANIRKPDGTPKRCHAHMFRDTFAVELLNKGVPIDRVSLLLGHSSVKVTEKHYAPFVKERQQQLEMYARMAWEDSVIDAADIQSGTPSLSKPASAQVN